MARRRKLSELSGKFLTAIGAAAPRDVEAEEKARDKRDTEANTKKPPLSKEERERWEEQKRLANEEAKAARKSKTAIVSTDDADDDDDPNGYVDQLLKDSRYDKIAETVQSNIADDPQKTPVAKQPKKPAPQATPASAAPTQAVLVAAPAPQAAPTPVPASKAPVPPLAVQAAPVSAQQSSGNGKAAMVSGSFVSPTNNGGDVATGPVASEFIRATVDDTIEEDRNEMRTLDFYGSIGNAMYDFDRGLGMSAPLRDWIKSAIKDDDNLSREIVTENLAEILGQKPNLIPAVKGVLRDVAENHILYRACFVSKLDQKEYEDRADAEVAIEAYKAIGATFESSYTTVYRRVKPDGTAGQRVPLDQVKAYVDKFDGDREALKRRLYIVDEAPAQPGDNTAGSISAAPGSTTAS